MSARMTSSQTQYRAFAMLGFVMLLWAGNAIVGRAVHGDIPPLTLAFLRWLCATLILAPFAARQAWSERAAIRAHWKSIALLGITGVGAFNGFLYAGLGHTTATNALLLQAGIPALVVVLDLMFFGTRPVAVQVVGVIFSTLGVFAIVFEGDPHAALRLHFGIGDVLVLCSVLVWALYTVLLRLKPKIAPESFVFVTFAIGIFAMGPFALGEWLAGERINWNWGVIGGIAYVSVLPSIVSYFIFNWATTQVGPARAGQAITLLPLFGALLSVLTLGEVLHWYHWLGMGLILGGIVVSALAHRSKNSAGA